MSETTVTQEAPAPKPAKKAKARKAPKVKSGESKLSKGQVRMLKYLAKRDRAPRPKLVIAFNKGKEEGTMDGSHLGCKDDKERSATDKRTGRLSLITRGLVKIVDIPKPDSENGATETFYEITASGRKAAAAN